MKNIASIFTNPKRNLVKARFLMGTMLSAVVWGSVHATPLDKALVMAQAPPQSEQEDKKQPPQRPGQRAAKVMLIGTTMRDKLFRRSRPRRRYGAPPRGAVHRSRPARITRARAYGGTTRTTWRWFL